MRENVLERGEYRTKAKYNSAPISSDENIYPNPPSLNQRAQRACMAKQRVVILSTLKKKVMLKPQSNDTIDNIN